MWFLFGLLGTVLGVIAVVVVAVVGWPVTLATVGLALVISFIVRFILKIK